jgi:Tripartite tricarboxylate transporter TctB family
MNDQNLVRGLVLIAISLAFGLTALRYPIGEFSHAGAGLFPLMVSSLLLLIGVITVVRSRFVERVPLDFNLKNIAIILVSLCGFALISKNLNMIVGILFMVFFASMAGKSSYSVVRNIKISLGLIAVAFAFQKLLSLSLPLY